ncbi:MAG: acriflavin resistance protein [Firmicutes bacterium]|nr:acriflavin resistance protein [Bacillota bacterium]
MKEFNLTEWALHHKQLIYYFILVIFFGGIFSYQRLGRLEDPDFTIRQMVVSVAWPGASAREVEEQVTDKLEKKLQDTPGLDYVKSFSSPGQAVIYVNIKDTITEDKVRPTWLEVRNMVNDIKGTLPQGVIGPFFNDRFDDVFGTIYAITGDGYSYEDMRENAEKIRRILLGIPNVKKVSLVGVQPEKIYIEVESSKLAELGVDPRVIISAVQTQSAMVPSGMLETSSDNVYLRVSGMFENVDALKSLPINVAGRNFRLGDIAKIERSYADPAEPKMFYNGQPAIGLAISMEKGGNVIELGENLDKAVPQIKKDLPLGLELSTVSNQPKVVKESINEFAESLAEAVIIVLIISFISLGVRSGIIVALCIPLVICGVFVTMKITGIDLQKISLGALIIALGLLVDDAIITVEMMNVKLEQGWPRFNAACFAYTATGYPRLTGALVTCAGFIPVGFSLGTAAEYVGSIFTVVTIALIISWVVAGTIAPLLGYLLIKVKPAGEQEQSVDIYDKKFYRIFKGVLVWCLTHRKLVLSVTLVCFLGSIALLGLVKQEFFPASTRPELMVDMRLPQGASQAATEQEVQRFAAMINDDPNIDHYTYYVGQGSPRFVLTITPTLPDTSYAQVIIVAKDFAARKALEKKVEGIFKTDFPNVRVNTSVIQVGPPSPYPVALRITGYDPNKVKDIAEQVRAVMIQDPTIKDINFDWNEKSKVMHLAIDQDKARAMGVDSQTLATSLQTFLAGAPIAEYREKDKTVNIVFRLDEVNRQELTQIKDVNIPVAGGKFVPLDQIATITYDAEEGLIWRRDLKPTITVQGNVAEGVMGNDVTKNVYDQLKPLRDSLPPGYTVKVDGPLEQSEKAINWLMGPVPVMLIVILTLLMFQLQSMPKVVLTLLTAPMGLIGVSIGLLVTSSPMGFVVELGILALAGIIMRNSVILIDQIEQQLAADESIWNAIINATVIRFRPIMLTAAAAILGMVPLVSSVFWGPMAVAIAGGLFGATVLTLLVLPTMYAAWFKVKPDESMGATNSTNDKAGIPIQ